MQHSIFSSGHSSYLVDKLNLTPIPFQAKRSSNFPSKRYLHTSIIYQGNLYLLGGIDNETDLKDNKLYCLELTTMKWTIIEGKNFSESRNSHSCTLFKNQIYFFGGSQHSNPTNDFFKFSPAQATWIQIDCEESVPPQRELAIFTSFNDQYIFLYGGIDILQDKIFDDAYLYKHKKWVKINTVNNPSERIKMGIAICGRRIFMFGGQGPQQDEIAIFDNLYEVIIDQFDLQVTFVEILCNKKKRPQKRTAHGMVGISSKYFLVYGGEGRLVEQNENSQNYILSDVWIYDVEEIGWLEIKTIGGSLTPRYEFSLSFYNNEIFIFGGMNDEHIVIDDLTRLQFMEYQQHDLQICQKCQKQYRQRQGTMERRQPSLSTGFYYNLAMEISFPFRAIQIIIEIAEQLQSQSIKIHSSKTIEQFDYMCFQFNAKINTQSSSFLNSLEASNNMFQANILHNLKIAALRLGKTFLYVEVDDQQRRVFLLSADNRYAPNFEQAFVHFSYVEKLTNFQIFYGKSFGNKQAIYNILKSQVSDPYSLLSREKGNFLTIFEMNILPTVQKAYYYELIFYHEPHSDIKIYHNEKKMQLIQSLGYSITTLPDFSLKNYLKYSKLNRNIRAYFDDEQEYLFTESYLQYLWEQNDSAIQLLNWVNLSSKFVQKCAIFQCIEGKYLQNNQGILIYCGNWLIDRYDSKLGQLISDKFYKKKYKKRQNIFKYTGVVYLSSQLGLNSSKTKIKSQLKYKEIIQELITKIKQYQNKDNFQENNQFDQLYQRLVNNKQNNKKLKRQ